MVKTILIWSAVIIAIILVLLWLISGGPRKIREAAGGIGNPLSAIFGFGTSKGAAFKLPWQPNDLNIAPELTFGTDTESGESPNPDELSDAEREYEELQRKIVAAKNFGEPSPYRGQVSIYEHAADESAESEYVSIQASSENTAPVSLAGWSLQSAVTGIRGFVPRGTSIFTLGAINAQQTISLEPGVSAVIASGFSPVGTSFRENLCTGYLSQMQDFRPSLGNRCPAPSESLPLTADNVRLYGESCIDFVRELPACTFPLTVPNNLTSACRGFIVEKLSYNGCVDTYRYRSTFLRGVWRIYLGAGNELWRNAHDVVRLLDAEGRTVDVLVY